MQTLLLDKALQENAGQLRSFAYKFTKDSSEVDDLVQDTMFKALRYANHFTQGTNFRAWLFTIMRNTFINDYRKTTRKNAVITQEEEISSAHLMNSSTCNAAEGRFAMSDIHRALAQLPENYYHPFIQYFEGYKYHEIAETLNIPIGTVKTRIHMARQLLQKQLKGYNKAA